MESAGSCSSIPIPKENGSVEYRLSFTHPAFDITDVEEVRLRFLLIANGLPNSTQLQTCVVVDYELDRLLKFYFNVFKYHIPRIMKSDEGSTGEDLEDKASMIKVGFAGLANLAGHSESIGLRMVGTSDFMEEMFKYWFSPEGNLFRAESILTLRNLSTNSEVAEALVEKFPAVVGESIRVISTCPRETVTDDLVRFLANMVQLPAARSLLIEQELIVKLLPFLKEDFQRERRHFVSHILKTSFRYDDDGVKFLRDDSDSEVLSYLLLPLAGGEEFTEEEYEAMPIDLQYLPTTKVRDPDPEIRYNLVSCIFHLSRTKRAREIMRSRNVYLILRELHKFEKAHPKGLAQTVDLIEDWVSAVILTEEED